MYAVNFVAVLTLMLSGAPGYNSIFAPIWATVYAIVFPAGAFFAWHWMLYRAVKSDASFLYVTYFVTFAIQVGIFGFITVGFFNGGGGGVLTAIDMFTRGKIVAGIVCTVSALVAAFCALLGLVLIRQVVSHYRDGNKHSVGRARQEAINAVASNATVRASAKDAVIASLNKV